MRSFVFVGCYLLTTIAIRSELLEFITSNLISFFVVKGISHKYASIFVPGA